MIIAALLLIGIATWLMRPRGELPCVSAVKWSPNKSSRDGKPVTALVWHYTAGPTAAGAIEWMANPVAGVSAHFVIGRDGTITQMVKLGDKAWHAGKTNGATNNASSIGVEVVNVGTVEPDGKGGWLRKVGGKLVPYRPDVPPVAALLRWPSGKAHNAWWIPFTQAQHHAMQRLVADLENSPYRSAVVNMVGHQDIATPEGRKLDPGPLFPWNLFPGRAPLRKAQWVA